MFRPFPITGAKGKSQPQGTAQAIDVAARHLVYKLFDATDGRAAAWQVLGKMIGESKETVKRAVERGWVIVREDAVGGVKVRSGMLTDEGRRVARRGLRT